jgi:hypothetical protein
MGETDAGAEGVLKRDRAVRGVSLYARTAERQRGLVICLAGPAT